MAACAFQNHPACHQDRDVIFMGITHNNDDIKEISMSDMYPMVLEKHQQVGPIKAEPEGESEIHATIRKQAIVKSEH